MMLYLETIHRLVMEGVFELVSFTVVRTCTHARIVMVVLYQFRLRWTVGYYNFVDAIDAVEKSLQPHVPDGEGSAAHSSPGMSTNIEKQLIIRVILKSRMAKHRTHECSEYPTNAK